MGLAFDLAELINVLAGGALAEGSSSVRARLERAAALRSTARAIRKDLSGLGFLRQVEVDSVAAYVASERFAAVVTDSSDQDDAHSRELADLLSRLDPNQQTLVIRRVQQVALAALLRNADPDNSVIIHMLGNIDETTLFLVNLGLDTSKAVADLTTVVESNRQAPAAIPASVPVKESPASLAARSLLALTVSAAVRDFGTIVRVDAGNRELIEWTGHALDMLIDSCECQVEQILLVLHRAQYQDFHGSANRVSGRELIAANLRLSHLAQDARTIAENLNAIEALPPSVQRLIDTTTSIGIVEDFLLLKVHDFSGLSEVDDDLNSPNFDEGLGRSTMAELTGALSDLGALRLDLRRAVSALIPQL